MQKKLRAAEEARSEVEATRDKFKTEASSLEREVRHITFVCHC